MCRSKPTLSEASLKLEKSRLAPKQRPPNTSTSPTMPVRADQVSPNLPKKEVSIERPSSGVVRNQKIESDVPYWSQPPRTPKHRVFNAPDDRAPIKDDSFVLPSDIELADPGEYMTALSKYPFETCPRCKSQRLTLRRNRDTGHIFVGCLGFSYFGGCRYTENLWDYNSRNSTTQHQLPIPKDYRPIRVQSTDTRAAEADPPTSSSALSLDSLMGCLSTIPFLFVIILLIGAIKSCFSED